MEILKYPDEFLRRTARPVENIDGALQDTIAQMTRVMYSHAGLGLAATQVGIDQCFFIYDMTCWADLGVIINPKIVSSTGIVIVEGEGCLSVPYTLGNIRRWAEITIVGADRDGNDIEIEADGLLSVVLQHEVDHLNGILVIDRIFKEVDNDGNKL